MIEVVVAGLVTGWAIAIPIGGVGELLVTLTAVVVAGLAVRTVTS